MILADHVAPGSVGHPLPQRRIVRWAPAATVLVALLTILVATGTPVVDIARYGVYAGWAIVLPGTLTYRALRRTPHSLVDDLAMGSAVGLILEIAAFVIFSSLNIQGFLWMWPLPVVTLFLVLPSLRRHWRPSWHWSAPLAWSWSVAGIVTFLLGYITFAFTRMNQPVPTGQTQSYFIDQLFSLAVIGEAKHHFPLQTPWVAGEALLYHWAAYTNMATASIISGVDAPTVLFRLTLPALCALAVVLLAVVGWRVSGKPWVGAIAAALMFAIGEIAVPGQALGPLGGITTFMAWASMSLVYGSVLTFALIAVVADRLGAADTVGRMGSGAWVLMAMLALALPGGKATILPVALCGIGLVCLTQVLSRRFTAAPWAIMGILLAGQLFGIGVWYRFTAQGLAIDPLSVLPARLDLGSGPVWKDVAVVIYALGGYGIYMLTRLIGIPLLAWQQRGKWSAIEWFLLGGTIGGLAATLLIFHPGWSQNFFIRTAWPFGAILSAMGVSALLDRYPVPARRLALIIGGAAAFAFGLSLYLWNNPGLPSGHEWRALNPTYWRGLLIGAMAIGTAAVLWTAAKFWPGLKNSWPVAALAVVLMAGLPTMVWDAYKYPNAAGSYQQSVSPQFAEGARWLRSTSDPDDIIATNLHCSEPPPAFCTASFALAAFSERRVVMETWAYTAKANAKAMNERGSLASLDVYDPAFLAANDAAIYDSSPATMTWLRDRHVRWIFVDRRFGKESATLSSLAALRWQEGELAIYQVG